MSESAHRLQCPPAQCWESVGGSDIRLWLWVHVIGAFAAEGWQEAEEWFLAQRATVARSLGISAYAELEDVLMSYIFFKICRQSPETACIKIGCLSRE